MNAQTGVLEQRPSAEEAARALDLLKAWAACAGVAEARALDHAVEKLAPARGRAYPALSREYPGGFRADPAYRAGLPDLQNGPAALIRGARRRIQHVGIAGFRLPVRFRLRGGGVRELEGAVTGTVSLEAQTKGINMSRIMRSFYAHSERRFSFDVIDAVLDDYKRDLDARDARILMRISWPMKLDSLRSGLSGWQYYDIALELAERAGERLRVLHLDYVYSSTCPCSLELSEHARRERGQLATPHSQRSVARLSMVIDPAAGFWFEDAVELCRRAVPTETQVIVKREDEQAFAELNAANPIFVEDAARLFAEALLSDPRVGDFRVIASHQESLHSHDAVSVLTEGETFDAAGLDPLLFGTMRHAG